MRLEAAAARAAGCEVAIIERSELPLLAVLGRELAEIYADAHAVVVGAGISPNTALAEAAGLHVDNGIVVNAHLVTSDPDVVAAGGVANAGNYYEVALRGELAKGEYRSPPWPWISSSVRRPC